MRKNKENIANTLSQDLMASIVVFLVAIPLCLGVAIACGVPPALGLISGIAGGLIAGSFTGCPLQVSGPAAGLIAIVWTLIEKHGIENFGLIVLCAGLLQILMGIFKLGRWFRAVSPSVIQGMLAGIGVLIFASQFHVMLDDKPMSNGLENLILIPQAIYKGIFPLDGSTHHMAAAIGIVTIVAILLWNMVPEKLKTIPGSLVGVLTATLVANIMAFPVNYVTVPQNLFSEIHFTKIAQFSNLTDPGILMSIVALAFIASAQALLTATAIDRMQNGTKTDYNKEVFAQGLGNTVAGFFGALPITGVIVRSTANIQAGGKTHKSTIFHGIWLLTFVMVLPQLLQYIPVASLAAVLVYTGYKLMNPQAAKEMLKYGKSEVAIYFATVLAIVSMDLLTGIIVGFVLSAGKLIYVLTHLDVNLKHNQEEGLIELDIHGSATFFTLPYLAEILEDVPARQEVHVYLVDLNYVDHACLELLMDWEKRYEANEGRVIMEWDHVVERFKQPKTMEKQLDLSNDEEKKLSQPLV